MPNPTSNDSTPDRTSPSMPGLLPVLRHFALPCATGLVVTLLVFDPLYRLAALLFVLPLFLHAGANVWWPDKVVHGRSALIQRGFRMIALVVTILGWGIVFVVVGYVLMSLLTSYTLNNTTLLVIESLTPIGFMVCAWFWWPAYAREVVPSWPDEAVRIRVLTSTRWQKELMTVAKQLRRNAAIPQYHGFLGTCGIIVAVAIVAIIGIFPGIVFRLFEIALILSLVPLHLIVVSQAETVCDLWQTEAAQVRAGDTR